MTFILIITLRAVPKICWPECHLFVLSTSNHQHESKWCMRMRKSRPPVFTWGQRNTSQSSVPAGCVAMISCPGKQIDDLIMKCWDPVKDKCCSPHTSHSTKLSFVTKPSVCEGKGFTFKPWWKVVSHAHTAVFHIDSWWVVVPGWCLMSLTVSTGFQHKSSDIRFQLLHWYLPQGIKLQH